MWLRSSLVLHFVTLVSFLLFVVDTTHAICSDEEKSSHPDKVHNLPGWNQPLPSAWYSGYIDYEFEGRQIHTHYVLVRAEDDDGHTKPLIYWSNGGPGASSLFGLFTELGPLMLSDLSLATPEYANSGIPTPMYNPYSWTRLGSILIFDQPAPVGFSYCNDDDTKNASTHSCGGLSWTDELASQNVYQALKAFYKAHPCFQNIDLFLTGESYAGIYVSCLEYYFFFFAGHRNPFLRRVQSPATNLKIPTLARQIVEDPKPELKVPLQGFAVGDGCLGTHTTMCGNLIPGHFVDYWYLIFMAGHHQIPLSTFHTLMNACTYLTGMSLKLESPDDAVCKKEVEKAKKQMGGLFEYSLYDECFYRNSLLREQQAQGVPLSLSSVVGGGLNDYPCGGGPVLEEYLKLDSVKEAFHVRSDFFEVDNAVGFDYTPTEPDLTGFYKSINGKLKVLIYNGDTDPAITSFAAQNWTSSIGFEANQTWRPWTVDHCQKMGGYVVRYNGMFDFLTIRGAGHMVPTYKPQASFVFLKAWMDGSDYPSFDPTCRSPPALNRPAGSGGFVSEATLGQGKPLDGETSKSNRLLG